MAIKLGNNNLNKAYLGNTEIKKMYLGNDIVFDNSVRPFIIEVNLPSGVGSTSSFQFTGAVGDYDVVAKQSGSIVQTFNNLSDESTINLSNGGGVYILEVKPKASNGFNRIEFNNSGDKDKIIDVKQFGDVVWSTFASAFRGCTNIKLNSSDAPNLSNVTSMREMFRDAVSFDQNINSWDVSSVTDISGIFLNAKLYNQPLNNWDVSSVTNMRDAFAQTEEFNQSLNDWDVSSVTNINSMFRITVAFNQPLNNWDVSNVTSMIKVFEGADLFNQPLNNWNVSLVNNMQQMFGNAESFNQNLSGWCVSIITQEPPSFDDGADDWVLPNSRPIWGTCP
jgi:hypothetical protein